LIAIKSSQLLAVSSQLYRNHTAAFAES